MSSSARPKHPLRARYGSQPSTTGRRPARRQKRSEPSSRGLIAQAAELKADLVVLPETLTYYNAGATPAEVAEPIPGPSTQYFAKLAKQYGMYIVAGLFEKDQYKVYNVAVLLTPEGEIGGKYRKITLPDGEASAGVVPGHEYPIFKTKFGMLGHDGLL